MRRMPPASVDLLSQLDYSVLQQCMHCGLCLPTCPTYAETGRERNSPRGRIALMRAIADRELGMSRTFADEMEYCLGCLACASACPAGVDYARLFEAARADSEQSGVHASVPRNLIRWLSLRVLFTRPRLLRFAGRLLRFWQAAGPRSLARRLGLLRLLPRRLRDLEASAPEVRLPFSDEQIAAFEPALDTTYHKVVLLTGCVQDLAYAHVNRATADVLRANGCDVLTPREQPCCGSLHIHNGDRETGRQLARRLLESIDPFSVDAVISNSGGCGSHLKHFGRLLADDPVYAERAAEWSRKLRDISEWLAEIGFRSPQSPSVPLTVTYHDSCHLCHGQRVSAQPRAILRSIPGLALQECAEASWCCGSAGIYSITHPETATWLQQRKMGHLRATGAVVIATANPGCHLQIQNGLGSDAGSIRVAHPVELLAEAYRREG